ncbi:Calx-beta domain-containing protein [Maribacter sp. MAR_2009_72]|uniref:Calx-beta domain-containing protein n=1 Tax=Maribacter sp. MAR_2009_72 TaxID=1250050 RepID=UPI00119A9CB2|nr:Calx-beta domain-containing protein [Maribacter sp. MAR_2009_72]TVZ16764.1 putative repeat protein (TIGR01451 family)/gliding motility-associated-like protein [Maribacter sp. MAR_2009_72]
MNKLNWHRYKSIITKLFCFGMLLGSSLMYGQRATISVDRNGSETAGPTSTGRFLVQLNSLFPPADIERTINYDVDELLTTATEGGVDRNDLSGELVLPAGEISGYIIVDGINDDALVEGEETLSVFLLPGDDYTINAGAASNSATMIIEDNDFATVTVSDTSAEEGTNLVFNLVADTRVEVDYTVTVNFSGGTATPGSGTLQDPEDYSAGERTVTFAVGQVSKQLAVTTLNDSNIEADETFEIILTSVDNSNIILGPNAEGTILNDDFIEVSVDPVRPTVNEDESGQDGRFRINLSEENNTGDDLTVSYTISGNATPDDDYVALSGTLIIEDGRSFRVIDIEAIDDLLVEGNEIIELTITGLDAGASTTAFEIGAVDSGVVTILDDDIPGVSVSPISGDTSEDLDTASFTLTLNTQPSAAVSIALSSSDATEGTVPASVTVPAANWDTGVTVTVTGVDDDVADGDIIYTINTGNVTSTDSNYNGLTGADVANVTVANNDNDTIGINIGAISGNTAEDGATATFLVTLDSQPTAPVTIALSSSDETEGTVPDNVVMNATNWQTGATVTITGVDDSAVDGDVEYTIVTGNVTSTDISYNGLDGDDVDDVTVINDDDDAFEASVQSTTASANENPVSNGVFTIDLGAVNQTGSPITVNYTMTGTATQGLDYSNLSGSVSIANNQRTATVTITPINDSAIENNETVILTLAAGTGYTIAAQNSATVIIISDDANIARITASDATAAESNGALATGEFTINLNSPNNTGSAITVNYTISGTATNGVDYTEINANAVVIPNGQQSAVLTITPINDQLQEGSENVVITLAAGTGYVLGAAATRSATVVIEDNDQASLSISNATVNEDVASGELLFNVVLNLAVVGGTTVNYSFEDDTAIGGGIDYDGVNGSLTFTGTANETLQIVVPIINDELLEETETFTVQLGVPTNNVQRTNGGTAIGTINDDDNCVAAPILDPSVSMIYCVEDGSDDGFIANLYDYTQSEAPTGTVLTWSRVSDPLNTDSHLSPTEAQNIDTQASYYGFFYDATNNCASGTIEVQIVENTIPQFVNVAGNERCGPGTLLLSAEPSEGASVNWYDAIDADTPIAFGQTFTTPRLSATRSYYVEATENGCTTARQEVVARVGVQATTGTAQNASICSLATNGLTSLDLDSTLTDADAGVWVFLSGPEDNVVINSTNVVNFEGLTSGDYIFRFTTTNSTAPCTNPSVDVTINVSDCESDNDNDGLLGGEEVGLGTDSNNPDTDGDSINDGEEVGPDINNPLDEDNDGIIDALDSNILDTDNDGVNDQQDPANNNPCIPNRFNGSCDTDGDGISDLDEQTNGSDPDDPCDPVESPDCDDPIDLEVLKTVDNPDALVGDTITFTILVTNLSNRTARAIVVGDLLELGFDFVSSTSANYDEITGNWNIAELEAGLSVELSITVVVAEQGPYTNTATLLESIPTDNNPANDEATVILNTEAPEGVDLKIEKEARPDKALVGDVVEFIIRVTNISESDVVTNIVVNDLILAENGFEFVSAESDFNGVYDETTGNWSIPSLNREETARLIISARVPQIGVFTNTANIVSSFPRDGNTLNNEATVEVEVINKTEAEPGFLFNQFSPNGNNQNEILRINRTLTDPETGVQTEVNLQYKIKIYDRYGNLVFETEKINDVDVWDGTYKGKEVPKGTYFYIMNYSINNEPAVIDKGWIQLIR